MCVCVCLCISAVFLLFGCLPVGPCRCLAVRTGCLSLSVCELCVVVCSRLSLLGVIVCLFGGSCAIVFWMFVDACVCLFRFVSDFSRLAECWLVCVRVRLWCWMLC